MNFTIREINKADYSELISLFTEFSAFEKRPEK